MFVSAIEEVGRFTRPIHTISRNYGETIVNPGAATLFFVNDEGCAVTCKHVINLIGNRKAINDRYEKFKQAKQKIEPGDHLAQQIEALETEYNYKPGTLVQLKEMFVGVTTEPKFNFRWICHPAYDLAIIQFENFRNARYQSHARFLKDSSLLKQGKSLCRLGFPFAEFTNFIYNAEIDDIDWTQTGQTETPRFPIEGMLTRHLVSGGEIMGIELSTPGLRGQSGGPVFDTNGIICGMQMSTNHLHLGFDMKDFEYKINGRQIKVTNQPFLHVGHCIHVDIIKRFLRENNIRFYEH
ncbi:MAG TPA: serine protease [Chitinophagaceae bacterium]|nr:serine protease [Chitinophagaceae bacterium]